MSNDEATRKNTADISAINAQLSGLSIEIKNVTMILNEIKDVLRDIGNTYVTKDICKLCHAQVAKDIEDMQKFKTWAYTAVIGSAGVIILELLKYMGGH